MEWKEKSQVVTSRERPDIGILIVTERVATALEDDPDSLDTP